MQLPQSMPICQFYYSIKIELIYEIVRIHQLYYSKYFIIHFQRRQIGMSGEIIRVLFCAYSIALNLWTKIAYHRIVDVFDNE